METFFARYRNPLVLAMVLVAQLILLAVQVRPRLPGAAVADQAGVKALRLGVASVVTPPEKVLHNSGLGVRGIWSNYIDLIDTKQQNQQLRAENQRLQLEEASLAEDAREGQRLQELLAFKQHYIDTTVPAEVVGTGGSDHGRLLYIDKGSNEGVAIDMAVITPDGIVGRIASVDPSTSQVLEINDPTSAAGVLLEQTRTRGIVRGNDVGQAEIVKLMPDSRIQRGQTVLTSGGDQIFPRGLPVGTVERVVPDVDDPPLVDVILKPAANLGRLEEVLVVTGTSPTPAPHFRHDLTHSEEVASAVKAAAAAKASAAAEAALEAQSASDILAQRLPSANNVTDVDDPDALPGSSPATANEAGAPLRPPTALHNDQFSPGAMPPAAEMVPGQRYGKLAEGIPSTDHANKTAGGPDGAALPSPSESAAFVAAHNAAMATRSPAPTAKFRVTPAAAAPGRPVEPRKVHPSSEAHAAILVHSSGQARTSMQPAPERHAAAPAANRTTRKPVQTEVITDGPITATRPAGENHASAAPRATGRQPAPAPRHRGPLLVPDDGSRPPRTVPQEPR